MQSKSIKDLIKITAAEFNVILDLRYATANNVCNIKLYSAPLCYLHKDAAEALQRAIKIAAKKSLRFKIFDGFRPMKVQQFMFDKFLDDGFISNPQTGSTPHCRGVAVDLTLVDANDNELEMGSDFDEFSDLAFHACERISPRAKQNRELLFDIMKEAGWDFYSKEWWHYQLFNARQFEIVRDDSLSAV